MEVDSFSLQALIFSQAKFLVLGYVGLRHFHSIAEQLWLLLCLSCHKWEPTGAINSFMVAYLIPLSLSREARRTLSLSSEARRTGDHEGQPWEAISSPSLWTALNNPTTLDCSLHFLTKELDKSMPLLLYHSPKQFSEHCSNIQWVGISRDRRVDLKSHLQRWWCFLK